MTSLPSTQLFLTLSWRADKGSWSNCAFVKKDQRRCKYLVLGRDRSYVVQNLSDSTKKFSKLIVSTCSSFWLTTYLLCFMDISFQRTAGMLMGKHCAPFLTDLLLDSYEAYFIQRLLKKNGKKQSRSINVPFRYIDDILSINNSTFTTIDFSKKDKRLDFH